MKYVLRCYGRTPEEAGSVATEFARVGGVLGKAGELPAAERPQALSLLGTFAFHADVAFTDPSKPEDGERLLCVIPMPERHAG